VTISNPDFWEKCLGQIKKEISEESYSTWFEPTRLYSITEDELILTVPNNFYKDCLQQNYLEVIKSVLDSFNNPSIKISFKLESKPLDFGQDDTKNLNPVHKYSHENTTIPSGNTINPKYNFDNFVVGSSNQFAHAAALSVADNPKVTYNPLFVYGGVGLGKTHLLHAMGNAT
jgi:chromosomal replication initiator protein